MLTQLRTYRKMLPGCLTRVHSLSAVKIEGLGRVNSARACQGESLRMSCEDPLNTLIIFKAEFADSGDPAVCPHQKFIAQVDSEGGDPLPCSEDVTKKIKNWCGWRSTCELRTNPAISDLCHGPNKFLSVAYSCGETLIFGLAWV